MALILTTAIEKGGTGKTTTVVNLAALMAAEGKQIAAEVQRYVDRKAGKR